MDQSFEEWNTTSAKQEQQEEDELQETKTKEQMALEEERLAQIELAKAR